MLRIAICDDDDGFLFLEQKLVSAYMEKHVYQYQADTFSSGMDLLQQDNAIANFDIIILGFEALSTSSSDVLSPMSIPTTTPIIRASYN